MRALRCLASAALLALTGCGLAYDVGATGIDTVPRDRCDANWELCEPSHWALPHGALEALAVDATSVYLAVDGGTKILRLPRDLSTAPADAPQVATATAGTGAMSPHALASDGTRVFWIPAGTRTILSAPVGGGASEPLEIPGDALAISGHSLVILQKSENLLQVRAPTGETQTVYPTAPITSFAADASGLAWTEQPADPSAGRIRFRSAEGTVSTVAETQPLPHEVGVDGASVYWVNKFGGIVEAPSAGGQFHVLLAGVGALTGLTHRGEWAFWLAPPAGSTPTPVVAWKVGASAGEKRSLGNGATTFVRDGAELFWIDRGALYRLAQ